MTSDPTILELVEHGLDAISADRMMQVPLRDLVQVHQALGELLRFFHQPLHYPKLADVVRFMGSRGEGGGFDVLLDAYYDKLGPLMPEDVKAMFADGVLEHPLLPTYYKHGA